VAILPHRRRCTVFDRGDARSADSFWSAFTCEMRSLMRSRSASANAAAMGRNSFDRPLPAMSPPRSSRWSFMPLAAWPNAIARGRLGKAAGGLIALGCIVRRPRWRCPVRAACARRNQNAAPVPIRMELIIESVTEDPRQRGVSKLPSVADPYTPKSRGAPSQARSFCGCWG
jgi:hypothetical protein